MRSDTDITDSPRSIFFEYSCPSTVSSISERFYIDFSKNHCSSNFQKTQRLLLPILLELEKQRFCYKTSCCLPRTMTWKRPISCCPNLPLKGQNWMIIILVKLPRARVESLVHLVEAMDPRPLNLGSWGPL